MLVKEPEKLYKVLSAMGSAFAYDTETVGCAPQGCPAMPSKDALILDRARIIVFSAAGRDAKGNLLSVVVPLAEHYGAGYMPRSEFISIARPFLESPEVTKVAHNANYDANVMNNHGIKVVNQDCTLIMGKCWDENLDASLKDRALLVGTLMRKTKQIDFEDMQKTAEYAEIDAITTWQLWEFYRDSPKFIPGNKAIYESTERPLIPVVQEMEQHGMLVNKAHFTKIEKRVRKDKDALMKAIQQDAGCAFNLNSAAQLADVLYNRLHIPSPGLKTSKSKHPPTDERTLHLLMGHHPIVGKIIEYRHMAKLYDSYVNPETGIVAYADAKGRIHATLRQTGAVTFRFSCGSPELLGLQGVIPVENLVNSGNLPSGKP